jgi:hypothetical protein
MIRMGTECFHPFGAKENVGFFVGGEADVVEAIEPLAESGENCKFAFLVSLVKSFI